MGNPLMTSLQEIYKYSPCEKGWQALVELLGEPYEHSKDWATPFKVSEIGKLGNLEWLCWTFFLFKDSDKAARRVYIEFGVWCAERVRHLLTDDRSIKALDVSREYLAGTATLEDLKSASAEAYCVYQEMPGSFSRWQPSKYLSSNYAAYSVWMASASLAGGRRALRNESDTAGFDSASYHAAEAIGSGDPDLLNEEFWKERGVQLAKLMELLDAGSYMSLTKESLDKTHAGTELDTPSKCLYTK